MNSEQIDKLAGMVNAAINSGGTARSAQHWKRKTALAIGQPDLADAPDEELEAAHDAHMLAVAGEQAKLDDDGGAEHAGDAAAVPAAARRVNTDGMPKEMADTMNSAARSAHVLQLVNEKQKEGGMFSDYMTAFNAVRQLNPHLFAAMHEAKPQR